jgi:sugar lactone lactonase YvrE
LNSPAGITVDSKGNLYIADAGNDRVRRVSQGIIDTVAGSGPPGLHNFGGDNGPAVTALLSRPMDVAVNSAGDLFIADTGSGRVRKVSNGVISTEALVIDPEAIAVDSAGALYVANTNYDEVLKFSNGARTIFAGLGSSLIDNGPFPYPFQPNALSPRGIAADAVGNVYISDTGYKRVRKVSNGTITTIAGTGEVGYSGDNGPAISARLGFPTRLATDSSGNLLVADSAVVREISAGTITTVVGGGTVDLGSAGFNGDTGPAVNAQLASPSGVAFDNLGNLLIADTGNSRIRVVSHGIISSVAGSGSYFSFGGDNGPAITARLNGPYGVAADSAGNLYIADTRNQRIRKVTTNGIITTVAGNGTAGFAGDSGPATNA